MDKKVLIIVGAVLGAIVLGVVILALWVMGIYNGLVTKEEKVNQAWGQVQNVYQRRLDLIPNLVETVKGYAEHEQETFAAVTEARSKVGGVMNMTPEMLNDPAMLQKFQQAQQGLSGALQRLMVVQERYPDLKANQNFLALQSQLEGTENRITVERQRFNEEVGAFNIAIRRFPASIIANFGGFDKKAYFAAEETAQEAPKVSFE